MPESGGMMAPVPDHSAASDDQIEIVGAGPAGLVCAIVLAKANRRVTVREWHKDVGHRFHDDFQGLENWTAAQDALGELAAVGADADRVRILRAHSSQVVRLRIADPARLAPLRSHETRARGARDL